MTDTLLQRLFNWASEEPEAPAQVWKKGSEWVPIPVKAVAENVEALARFLVKEGLTPGDVGLIYAYNSPAYAQFDLALMLARGSSGGIYVNASSHHINYIMKHAEAKFFLVDRIEDARKAFGDGDPRRQFPDLRKIIVSQSAGALPGGGVSF